MATKTNRKKTLKDPKVKEAFHRAFLHYYLGILDGSCFNNATRSWLMAKGYTHSQIKELSAPEIIEVAVETEMVDMEGDKHQVIKKKKVYAPVYETARTESIRLLTNPHIVKLKDTILKDMLKDIEGIKKRHVELAQQNKNLPVSRQANADLLKVVGALDDKTVIDIPALSNLTDAVAKILKGNNKK